MAHWTPPHFYQRIFEVLPASAQTEGRIDWLHPRLAALHDDMLPVSAKRMRRILAMRTDLSNNFPTRFVLPLDPALVLRMNPVLVTDNGGAPTLFGNAAFQCKGCRTWKHPAVFVDVRALDVGLTDGLDFACDGCWNGWILKGKTLNGQKLSRRLWIEALGAPQALLDKVDALPASDSVLWMWTKPDLSGRAKRFETP